MSSFKEKLRKGRPQIGTLVSLGSPSIAEVLSRCGFDWLWIDMEHSPLSLEQTQSLIQAKEKTCTALVRLPSNDEVWIKRVLDLGADGIIVPHVSTAAEAEMAVTASKYPPTGTRSVGLSRAQCFGMDFASYLHEANDRLAVILQIEHVEGVRNIDSILKVPGVDGIIIGPYDLSGSYGKTGQLQDPEVKQAMKTVNEACKRHHIPLGVFALTPEQGQQYLKLGYQLVSVGVDIHYLWTAAKAGLESLKSETLAVVAK
jgi:2-keto-3-deoxy-L-rhamnonate aldolase RhmA